MLDFLPPGGSVPDQDFHNFSGPTDSSENPQTQKPPVEAALIFKQTNV